MLNGDSVSSIITVTLMIMTVLMLSYHLAYFISKHEFENYKNYTIIDRLTKTEREVVVFTPVEE
jgi:hypothetical protein